MANVGELLVGDYLRVVRNCDFIDYNVYTRDAQGEIDVVGIDNKAKKVFICEVAIHLTTGIQYTKNKRPDTHPRMVAKFNKDIDYATKVFSEYSWEFMLWSPIVKNQKGKTEYNQIGLLNKIVEDIQKSRNVKIELMVNEAFHTAFMELKKYAARTSEELKSPVLRLLQIEAWLEKHIKNTSLKGKEKNQGSEIIGVESEPDIAIQTDNFQVGKRRSGNPEAVLRALKKEGNRSWKMLKIGCEALMGRDTKASTPNVFAASKTFARKASKNTGMTYQEILEWLIENEL